MSEMSTNRTTVVSRAMERNKVVTGLAQIVIVAESVTEGGTWVGATGALRQNRPLYVRDTASSSALPGNKALIELGGLPLPWPTEQLADVLSPLLQKSAALHQEKDDELSRPDQLSLFALSGK
jgi:predicted Rossmann fold nucleotide-binding protein DprA/Smf involved in DNA uptake